MNDLSGFTKSAIVRGSIQAGVKPHVKLYGARYSNPILKQTPGLIGKRIEVSIDLRDLRFVGARAESGEELGILQASPPWHLVPHTLEMRQSVMRLERSCKLNKVKASDPMITYADYLEKHGTKGDVVSVHYLELRKFLMDRDEADRSRADSTPCEKPADEDNAAPHNVSSQATKRG
jgi:hypothetical protein